jgi:hypothetical protein
MLAWTSWSSQALVRLRDSPTTTIDGGQPAFAMELVPRIARSQTMDAFHRAGAADVGGTHPQHNRVMPRLVLLGVFAASLRLARREVWSAHPPERWVFGCFLCGRSVPVALVLAFGIVLLISVSLSGVAARTVLSTALLFLLAGALIGQGGFGLVDIPSDGPFVTGLADLALFTVLFTDGQRAGLPALREGWRLSGRALGLAMPLTMVGIALPAHYLAGLDWPTAFLVGAILSPTDPVFAAAIVGREDVPLRLRRLLNVESGLNDGLALPFVLIFLATAANQDAHLGEVALELVAGLALGIAIPAVAVLAWRL